MVNELSPAAKAAQQKAAEVGAANVPQTVTPTHTTIRLTENLGIGDSVSGYVSSGRAIEGTAPEPPKPQAATARTVSQIRVEKARTKSELVAAEVEKARIKSEITRIESELARRPQQYEAVETGRFVGGRAAPYRRPVADPEGERLARDLAQRQAALATVSGREAELRAALGNYGTMEKRAVTQFASDTAAQSQQQQYRERSIAAQQAAQKPFDVTRQETEAKALVSEYGFRKPSAYQIPLEYVTPGGIDEISRQNVLSFIQAEAPELAQKYSSVFGVYKEPAPETSTSYSIGLSEGPSGRTDYSISLTEGAERKPRAFGVSLTEGTPKAPREYSQAEINAMSPQQYAVYRSEIDQYNKFVTEYNKSQKERVLFQKKENLEQYKASKKEILGFIDEAKKSGIQYVTINTTSGVREVPIARAYKEIVSAKNVIGIGVVPVVPAGFTLAGNLGSPVLVPTTTTFVQDPFGTVREVEAGGTREPARTSDVLERDLATLRTARTADPFTEKVTKPFFLEVAAGVATLMNLRKIAGQKFGGEQFEQQTIIPQLTATSEYASGLVGGAARAVEKGNVKYFVGGAGEAYRKAEVLAKEQGLIATGAGLAGFLYPFGVGGLGRTGTKAVAATLAALRTAPKGVMSVVSKIRIQRAIEAPVGLVRREGTRTLQTIRPYPQALLRNRGFEDTVATLRRTMPPPPPKLSRMIRFTPTAVQESGVTAAKKPVLPVSYSEASRQLDRKFVERFRKQIDEGTIKVQRDPPSSDPFYDPAAAIPRTRSGLRSKKVEPKIYRVQYDELYGKDTASTFGRTRAPLGSSIIKYLGELPKKPVSITQARINLGAATKTITGIGLGRGYSKLVRTKPPKTAPFVKTSLGLGKSTKTITRVRLGRGTAVKTGETFMEKKDIETFQRLFPAEKDFGKTVEPDPFYSPAENIERTRSKFRSKKVEPKIYRVETEKVFAKDTASTFKTTKIKTGMARIWSGRLDRVPLGKGEATFLGMEKGAFKKSTVPFKPRPDDVTGKSGAKTILAKPAPTKFTSTTVKLGSGRIVKPAAVGTAAVSAPAAVPVPRAIGDAVNNMTGGNTTNPIPLPPTDIALEQEQQSALEPQSITQNRPAFVAAVRPSGAALSATLTGAAAGTRISTGVASRAQIASRTRLAQPQLSRQQSRTFAIFKPVQSFKQAQRQALRTRTPFPTPQKSGLVLAQPPAFRTRQALRFRFPKPPKPPRLVPPAFFPSTKDATKKRQDEIFGKKVDFLGNVPVTEISGVFKRPDIIYGGARTAKLVGVDIRKSGKGRFSKDRGSAPLGAKPVQFFTRSDKDEKKALKKLGSGKTLL